MSRASRQHWKRRLHSVLGSLCSGEGNSDVSISGVVSHLSDGKLPIAIRLSVAEVRVESGATGTVRGVNTRLVDILVEKDRVETHSPTIGAVVGASSSNDIQDLDIGQRLLKQRHPVTPTDSDGLDVCLRKPSLVDLQRSGEMGRRVELGEISWLVYQPIEDATHHA